MKVQTARATIDVISIFCPACGEAQPNPATGALNFAASDIGDNSAEDRERLRPGRVVRCAAGWNGCGASFRLPALIGRLG